ncbi:MAG TPA: alpha/beta fold hydrolase [Terriglobales bacterium]
MPASLAEPFLDRASDPPVRGFLHASRNPSGPALVLTHGAGSNANAPFLVALAGAFADAGIAVLRCDLPFRQVRSFGPPRPGDAARDRQGLLHAVQAMKKQSSGRIFLGGHSYGGRQGSMLVAETPELVAGLLLSSYPLHPPSNPARMRTEHLPKVNIPTLFVQGTRDPFGSIEQIEAARHLLPAKTQLLIVEGVGHDLGFSRKIAANAKELPGRVLNSFLELVGLSAALPR